MTREELHFVLDTPYTPKMWVCIAVYDRSVSRGEWTTAAAEQFNADMLSLAKEARS